MIVLVALAVAVAVIDARDRVIPNALSGLVALWGLCLQAARALGMRGILPPAVRALAAALDARTWFSPGACLAFAAMLLVAATALELAWRRARGSAGIGLGDVKYLAAWSCAIGPVSIAALAVACAAGGLAAALRRQATFALGPWLSASLVAATLLLASGLPHGALTLS